MRRFCLFSQTSSPLGSASSIFIGTPQARLIIWKISLAHVAAFHQLSLTAMLNYKKIKKSLKEVRDALERLELLEPMLDENSSDMSALKNSRQLSEFTVSVHKLIGNIPDPFLPTMVQSAHAVIESKPSKQLHSAVVSSDVSEDKFQALLKATEDRLRQTIQAELAKITVADAFVPAPVPNGQIYSDTYATEDAVRQSEQRLRTIIDSTPLGIVITNEECKIEYVNSAYAQLYGYQPSELIGNSFTMIVPPDKREFWIDLHAKYLAGYKDIRGEWEVRHKTGKPIYILADAARIVGTDGKPKKVTFVSDISELIKLKDDARQSEMQLMQAEKMSSLGQMVAGVAHEMNTPLGFVRSNMDLLMEMFAEMKILLERYNSLREEILHGSPVSVAQAMAAIEEATQKFTLYKQVDKISQNSIDGLTRIQELVSNLRNFSRLDEANFKPASLNQLLDSTLNIAGYLLKDITVEKHYGNVPNVMCYAAQLNQVFLNLITNAVQAITHDHGKITISTAREGESIVVKITDNGIGIAPEHLNKIFEPFFTTKEIGKGTGLGLSIVYKIVEKHHGTIHVESERGKGSTFTITLPIGQAIADAESTALFSES